MKNMRYLCLFVAMTSGSVFAQQRLEVSQADFISPTARMLSASQLAAAQGLRHFAAGFTDQGGKLPPGFPLAVNDVGELRNVKAGWGFQVYDVDPAVLSSNLSLEVSARPTGIWRYAVTLHGRTVGLVTMARSARGWEVVSMGGSKLANDIDGVVGRYGMSAGTQLRYVRVPQATADFIQVKRGMEPAQFAPLQATRRMLSSSSRLQTRELAGDALLSGNDLKTTLRQTVVRNATH